MELKTAISLIDKGVLRGAGPQWWADLGAGQGLFARALGTLLEEGSVVYALDRDANALRSIQLPDDKVTLHLLQQEIQATSFPREPLDGLIMANALHFVNQHQQRLQRFADSLSGTGRIIVVEYDTDTPTSWIPHPISYKTLQKITAAGFRNVSKIGETPSAFGRTTIYAALLLP